MRGLDEALVPLLTLLCATLPLSAHGQNFTSPYDPYDPYDPNDPNDETRNLSSCSGLRETFFSNLSQNCEPAIEALECNSLGLAPHRRVELASLVYGCTDDVYRDTFGCMQSTTPNYPTGRDGTFEPDFELADEACSRFDFMEILEEAASSYTTTSSSTYGSCCPSSSSATSTANRLERVLSDVPIHYARCLYQHPRSIDECVQFEIDKLAWMPGSLPVLYGGQATCPPTYAFLSTIIVPMMFLFAKVSIDIILWKKQIMQPRTDGTKPKAFSWLRLVRWSLYAYGLPVITAFTLYRGSENVAFQALLAIFALRPNALPIVAFVSAVFKLSRGYGASLLFIDSIIGLLGWVYYNPRIDFWNEPSSPPTAPSDLHTFWKGIFLATLPASIFVFAYVASGVLFGVLIWWSYKSKDKTPAKLAGKLFLLWFSFALWCLLIPMFALWELGWVIYAKVKKLEGEEAVFPVVSFHRGMFSSAAAPHWLFRLAKHYLFWAWCGMQFVAHIGRWMAVIKLMPLLGDSFCPTRYGESIALTICSAFLIHALPYLFIWLGF